MTQPGPDILRGTLDLLLLKALSWGPAHGYAVARWIEVATNDALAVGEGTLYPALHRLEERGWIAASWGNSENNRRAKFYSLNAALASCASNPTTGVATQPRCLPPSKPPHCGRRTLAMTRWTRFRRLFGPEPEGDVDDELSFHLEMRIRELVERGESPDRARELARQRFGDYDRSRRECVVIDQRRTRRMRLREYVSEFRQDVAYALRMLRRAPGFTTVAVVTLALGIGANSAIFSVVHGVLLESLPFRDAERLYRIRMVYPDGNAYTTLSAPDFMSVREQNRVFEQVDAYTTGIVTMLGAGEPLEVRVASVSDGLFTLLGMPVVLGRGFVPQENTPGQNNIAVLDHGFWQRAFGSDHRVIDRNVTIGGISYTIVGVLAPGTRLPADVPGARVPSEADVYLPIEYGESFSALTATSRRSNYLAVLAQARRGATAAAIDEDLRRLGTQLQAAFPETNGALTFNAIAARDQMLGDVRKPLLMLLGAVGFVLLVACANVASLMVARASVRRGELAVRAALGAGRGRLLRQLTTEAVVLGLVGGAVGLALAYLVLYFTITVTYFTGQAARPSSLALSLANRSARSSRVNVH